MTNNAIESPKRTALILAIADSLGIERSDISSIIHDAIGNDRIHPYDALPDRQGIDPKTTLIALCDAIIGYDDDHDDAMHDLDHATDNLDYCDDHPTICSTCCDDH